MLAHAFESTFPSEEPERDAPATLIGRKVGTIRILRLLGEGGMGAVYAGFDERLYREVALKAVRLDRLSANSRARLLAEARVLSRVNHPGICSIYDFISGQQADFLVLERIRGTTLREAIQAGIDPALRLGIAERIAEALVAAHAQGIIHRDLKTSNVMLTHDGGVKVLDFGIARLCEEDAPAELLPEDMAFLDADAARTAPGKVVGTAGCMSPEQARGEPVTVASDLYSFGLLLQELFTGKPPYPAGISAIDLMRQVQKGETLPVTGVNRDLTELIESLKSSSPAERPTAAGALQRLRWIEGKPRRRARALAAGILLLLVLTGGLKYTLDLRRERDTALRARAEAESANAESEEVQAFLLDLFKVSDPGEARGGTVTARELLDRGARKVRQSLRGQPPAQARLLDAIGQVYLKLGLYAEADPLLREGLRIRTGLPEHPLDLAASLEHLGTLAQARNQPEAEALFQEALRLVDSRIGRRTPEAARLLNSLGIAYGMQGMMPKAEALFREALEIREATLGPVHPDVAATLNNLGMARSSQGDTRQAEVLLRRGLAIREKVLPADHPDLAANLEALAVLNSDAGRYRESVPYHRRALAIAEKAQGPSHPRIALILSNLGADLGKSGRRREAEALLLRAVRMRETLLGPAHPDLANAQVRLADVYRAEGRYGEARPLYRRALNILAAKYPADHPRVVAVREAYAGMPGGTNSSSRAE
ncbi:MAG: tetratricopeptide repeat protein [Thermoanaerobaculia bacterium]